MKRPPESIDDLPPEEREHVKRMLLKLMEMGIGAVYGDEDDGADESSVNCDPRLDRCRAACCTYHFALTRDEAEAGKIAFDPRRPFFISRDDDGYCTYLDRASLRCIIWAERPARCRKYDCGADPRHAGAEWL